MFTPNLKHKKWLAELEDIHNKVFFLQRNNQEFHKLKDKFNNKELPYDIFAFMRRNYITFMAMAIRRLVDRHKDVVSLIKIMDDLALNSDAVTRKWFLQLWPDASGEKLFEQFFGDNLVLNRETINEDMQELEFHTKKVADHADKWEAHWDKKRYTTGTVNFNDLDKAVRVLVEVYKRYYYLLKQSTIDFR